MKKKENKLTKVSNSNSFCDHLLPLECIGTFRCFQHCSDTAWKCAESRKLLIKSKRDRQKLGSSRENRGIQDSKSGVDVGGKQTG